MNYQCHEQVEHRISGPTTSIILDRRWHYNIAMVNDLIMAYHDHSTTMHMPPPTMVDQRMAQAFWIF